MVTPRRQSPSEDPSSCRHGDKPPIEIPFQLMRTAVFFRLGLLLAMAISCHLIPDHNPGDDVLRFDLRLDFSDSGNLNPCFCLSGFACDSAAPHQPDHPQKTTKRDPECAKSPRLVFDPQSYAASVYRFFLSPVTKWDAARFLTLAAKPSVRDPEREPSFADDPFTQSEQAHAFFPLFPWCIRTFSNLLTEILPSSLLPPTYEATLALSAVILNSICFLLTVLGLYNLSIRLFQPHYATLICRLFIFNPASVFFATAYSESLFAMLTFWGHALAARGRLELAVLLPWTLATLCRSNGTIHSAYILLLGLGRLLLCGWNNRFRAVGTLMYHFILASIVALPLRIHDILGYNRHCLFSGYPYNNLNSPALPEWCSSPSGLFSLYGYTQKKHWNVGFLRYYEWKQVPNFMLAAPVLAIGLYGAASWIAASMADFRKGEKPSTLWNILQWALTSLRRFASPFNSTATTSTSQSLVDNPLLLGHYAVLAATCLIGLFLAHVQISTRMIFSTCPAIYFFLADCMIRTPRASHAIKFYCCLYIVLGVILHVNFLPWT